MHTLGGVIRYRCIIYLFIFIMQIILYTGNNIYDLLVNELEYNMIRSRIRSIIRPVYYTTSDDVTNQYFEIC